MCKQYLVSVVAFLLVVLVLPLAHSKQPLEFEENLGQPLTTPRAFQETTSVTPLPSPSGDTLWVVFFADRIVANNT
jgi:hypothetical protein